MSIINDLIEALFEKSSVNLQGELTIRLMPGSVQITGQFPITVNDKQNKPVATVIVPVDANVAVTLKPFQIPTLK
jgi:hypothetical protein